MYKILIAQQMIKNERNCNAKLCCEASAFRPDNEREPGSYDTLRDFLFFPKKHWSLRKFSQLSYWKEF